MNADVHTNTLILEIARYLAAVDAFRAERCEPNWRPEPWPELSPIARRGSAHGKPASQAAS